MSLHSQNNNQIFVFNDRYDIIISREVKKKGLNGDDFTDILFYGIIVGILGARIYYVLFNLDYYFHFPKEIIMIWNGGLAIHGGIITALVFLFFYTRKKKINLLLLLDTIVVGLIIAQAIGRWGNFFNREVFGEYTEGIFAMRIPAEMVRRSDISEAIAMSDKIIVLSKRPASIISIHEISIECEERTPLKTRTSKEFREYYKDNTIQLSSSNLIL